eukprot:g3529.t1
MSLKKTLLDVAKRTAPKRFRNRKDSFAGIELDIDPPEEHSPSPLRFDDESSSETIDQQRRRSAHRLLRDRFVNDGGYLQSRTPFPLDAPLWSQIDQDGPKLTPEGQLLEDICHFVDYLACKDTSLAFHLNEMLLESPSTVINGFELLCRLTNKPLCRHEVIGRGYIFSKELVLSPSVFAGSLVLNRRVQDFEIGLKYLWILNRKFVERQRTEVQGFDLVTLASGALLLIDTFRVLHNSLYWTEAQFVCELKELSLVFPELGTSLSSLESKFVVSEILMKRKRAVRRVLELQRILREELTPVEILNTLGKNPVLFLQTDDQNFQSILQWIQIFKELKCSWSTALKCSETMFEFWNQQDSEIENFTQQFSNLKQQFPLLVRNAIESKSTLREFIKDLETIHNKALQLNEIDDDDDVSSQILGSSAVLLSGTQSVEELKTGFSNLMELLPEWDLYGKFSIQSLISSEQEQIVFGIESWINKYLKVKSMIHSSVSKDEMEDFRQTLDLHDFIICFKKLNEVISLLETHFHQNQQDMNNSFRTLIQRIRSWKHRGTLPKEIVLLVNKLPANCIAKLLMMNSESLQEIESSLFVMFGRSPIVIISCLVQLPELLADPEEMNLALSVARCKKVTVTNLRDESFRFPDRLLSILMSTLKLKRLTKMKLLQNLSHAPIQETMIVQLTQFLILCIDHPGAWKQFVKLLEYVSNPVLESYNSEIVDEMKQEAFKTILGAPEIFLLADLWDAILIKMQSDKWKFARLDMETVKDTEPCLLYYAVQHYWKEKYNRDPMKLIAKSKNQHFAKQTIKIRSLACDGSLIFAAVKGGIEVCKRVERILFKNFGDGELIAIQMIRLGPFLLCLMNNNSIMTLKTTAMLDEPISTVQLDSGFRANCMTHLDTYVNKILIGSDQGVLELHNFITGEKLHSFKTCWSSSIRHLEPAPALDVVGIGLSNGSIQLFNVRHNELIFKFETYRSGGNKTVSSCTCLTFSQGVRVSLLATGGINGEIIIWDLDQQEILCSKLHGHTNTVLKLHFFPSSFILMSLADDNSIKQWTVDFQLKELRLLRQRCGPKRPPALLKFTPDNLTLLLCDIESNLWSVSTIQDQQTRQLSSKKTNLSSRPLDLAVCWTRERDWGNILSVHNGQKSPFLWSSRNFTLEKNTFVVPGLVKRKKNQQFSSNYLQATAVALSQCGNFGFVGYESGALHKFNVQSGFYRGSFGEFGNAHNSRIVALAADQINRRILSASTDGALRVWDFKTRNLLHEQCWNSPISVMTAHTGNSLSAVGLDDLRLEIFDFEFYRIVRKFHGVKDRITSMQISVDGRWLLVSSMDRCLTIFDIPSANQIQVLFFKEPVLCFSLSESLEVLATAHLNQRGVTLWVNQHLLSTGSNAPVAVLETSAISSPQVISGEKLMKLGMTSVRNWSVDYGSSMKEKLQAKKQKEQKIKVPFFLPPLISANSAEQFGHQMEIDEAPRTVQLTPIVSSEFLRRLQMFKSNGDHSSFLEFLKKQSVVYIEQEILSLTIEANLDPEQEIQLSDLDGLSSLLNFLEIMVESEQEVEFVQVLLKMVLQMKCPILILADPLNAQIIRIQEKLEKQWLKLESLLEFTQCLVSVFSGLHG